MNISRLFIVRPVATSLLMIALVLMGLVSVSFLPVSSLPDVDYPTIQVQTFYPGASPQVMSTTVTAPLEVQLGQIPGLQQMTSSSSATASVITLQFDLSMDLDVAEQDVQEAINAAQNYLPAQLPMPPIYSKVNPADAPILTLALTSDSMPLSQVEDYTDTRLAEKISQLPGVGAVTISGGQKPAVRIQINPTQLASYGLNLEDVRAALTATSLDTAKGSFDGPAQSFQIGANDQITTSADFKQIVLTYRNGAPIMLTDVANVIDGVENAELSAWMNKVPAVIVNIQRQPGANIINVVDSIKALLPKLRATIPPVIKVTVLTDRTTTVRASVADVEFELMLCIALVVAVIFVCGDDHPRRRSAAVAGRDLRRDVRAWLQPQQSDPDGAHHLHRLRGRRCHRDDRKHHPLCRTRRAAPGGGSQGRGADRLYDHVADRFADCRADSAPVHGRHHRPAVP
jgi:multidrug efflux pump